MRQVTMPQFGSVSYSGALEAQQRERRRQEHDPPRVGRVDDAQEAERDLRQPAPVGAREALEVLGVPDPVELLAGQGDLGLLLGRHGAARLPVGLRRLDQLHAGEVARLRHRSSMSTRSPAAMSPSPAGMRASASAPEHRREHVRLLRLGRPRDPAVVALLEPDADHLVALRVAPQRLAERARRAARMPGSAPWSARTAGRANRWKVTIAETGLPGQPEHERAVAAAEPRRLARLKPHAPEALLDARARRAPASRGRGGPTDTPPVTHTTSAAPSADASAARVASASSGTWPRSHDVGARCARPARRRRRRSSS